MNKVKMNFMKYSAYIEGSLKDIKNKKVFNQISSKCRGFEKNNKKGETK